MSSRKFGIETEYQFTVPEGHVSGSDLNDQTKRLFKQVTSTDWSRNVCETYNDQASIILDTSNVKDSSTLTLEYRTPALQYQDFWSALILGDERLLRSTKGKEPPYRLYRASTDYYTKDDGRLSHTGSHFNFDLPLDIGRARRFIQVDPGSIDQKLIGQESDILDSLAILISYVTGSGYYSVQEKRYVVSDRLAALKQLADFSSFSTLAKSNRSHGQFDRFHFALLDSNFYPWSAGVAMGLLDMAVALYGHYEKVGSLPNSILKQPFEDLINLPLWTNEESEKIEISPHDLLASVCDWFIKAADYLDFCHLLLDYQSWAVSEFVFAVNCLAKGEIEPLLGSCEWLTSLWLIDQLKKDDPNIDPWNLANASIELKALDSQLRPELMAMFPSRPVPFLT